MNSFFVLTVLCTAIAVHGITPEAEEMLKVTFKDCIDSTGVNPEVILKIRHGQFVDAPKVGECMFCFFTKLGLMNNAGEIQSDVIKTSMLKELSAAEVKTVMEKCKDITGKDKNEKAYNAYKCYWRAASNHINLSK